MAKKLNSKQTKPLPSALTVANPVQYKAPALPESENSFITAAAGDLAPATKTKAKRQPRAKMGAPRVITPERTFGNSHRRAADAEITFLLHDPDARGVFLSGTFNGWSPEATPMDKQANGCWHRTLTLPPGRYEYKFVVDGQWLPDVQAKNHVRNEFGSLNSILEVTEARTQ